MKVNVKGYEEEFTVSTYKNETVTEETGYTELLISENDDIIAFDEAICEYVRLGTVE